MAYTTIDDPSAYFQTAIWSGTGSALSVTFDGNSDMQPDMVWVKNRTVASDHRLTDSVRGTGSHLVPNDTAIQDTSSSALTAFNSDGFSVGTEQSYSRSGSNHVAWAWKAGTSFSNSAGANGADIASSGSVNTTAGFSIVKWVGNGTDDQQISHGLSSTVKMILCKRYIGGSADAWAVYHVGLPVTQYLVLNTTAAGASDNEVIWSDEHPTSSVFTVGNHGMTNDDGATMIGYCFADVKGYSKFGKYTGNGNANGAFIYTGFKPAWVMFKQTSGGNHWYMFDHKRNSFNPKNTMIKADTNDADSTDLQVDFLSNGIKYVTNDHNNSNGQTYVYMAFAENPFVTSTGIPATAE
jgi:hypothetical protein